MDEPSIPFGLDTNTGALVDVYDVPRGQECGCICPSCKTPLIARQGHVNEWHFAHASRTHYAQTQNECDYSFYMSVRLMARQIFDTETIAIDLPEYTEEVHKSDYSELYTITPAGTITLSDIELEKPISKVPVDIYGKVVGYAFIIYFTHDQRFVPSELYTTADKQGVIAISLNDTQSLFFKKRGRPYKELLREYLKKNIKSKEWIYHPRKASQKEKALKRLQFISSQHVEDDDESEYLSGNPVDAFTSVIKRTYPNTQSMNEADDLDEKITFECRKCDFKWAGYRRGGNECPQCKTHLYSVEVIY